MALNVSPKSTHTPRPRVHYTFVPAHTIKPGMLFLGEPVETVEQHRPDDQPEDIVTVNGRWTIWAGADVPVVIP